MACTYVAELQPVIDGAYGHLDAWLMKRCNVRAPQFFLWDL
jgi:hypothetical protein